MTRRISLIVGAAFAVMAVAAPTALGMNRDGESLLSVVPATNGLSDASDRAKLDGPVAPLDVFERAVVASQRDLRGGNPYVDAHQRAFGGNRGSELTATTYPDAFERAVAARGATGAYLVGDSHDRIDPGSNPVSVPTVSSGREIEWPQIGIGFGIGIVLLGGLVLAMRARRTPPLAH